MIRPLLAGTLAFSIVACEGRTEDGISREDFVRAYVDLRGATVDGRLDAATRDSILEAHGTSEEELRAYIETRAANPEDIADTWREIMDSIAAREAPPAEPDTLSDP